MSLRPSWHLEKRAVFMKNVLLYLAAVLIWGTTWFAITFQLGEVAIEWSLVYRFALSAVILFGVCLVSGRSLKFPRRSHLVFFGLGVFLFSANYYFSYLAVDMITSGLVAVMFSALPLMNMLNAGIFLKQKLERVVLISSLVGIGGIILVFWPELDAQAGNDKALMGVMAGLFAAYLASVGNTIAASKGAAKLSVLSMNAWGMLYGTVLLTLFTLGNGAPITFDTGSPYLISLFYLAVFGTIIAFTSYLVLIKRIGSARAGYATVAFPLVALTISTFFEDYQWTLQAGLGMVLVLGGNYYILKTRTKKATK